MKIHSNFMLFFLYSDFQERLDTLQASWDLSGDPCPSVRNEWQIQKLDGEVVSEWLDIAGK